MQDGLIEELSNVPIDTVRKILGNASKNKVPVEVDGIVYYIPKAVSDLISSLADQAGIETIIKPVPGLPK